MASDRSRLRPATDLTGGLRAKSRRRRAGHATSLTPGEAPARNDLLPALQLVHLRLDEIRVAPRKTRPATEAHIAEVMRSIQRFGFCTRVIIGKDNLVIDGEVVLEAAKRLGLGSLPCIRVDHLTPVEQRLLRLALNRLAEKGSWDLPMLKLEFEELIELGAPVCDLGFEAVEIDQILLDDDDAIETGALEPAPGVVAVAQVGDMFRLGPHRVICGDATDASVIATLMQGSSARLVLTDVPYNVPIKGHVTGGEHREFAMASGEMSDDEFGRFNQAWMIAAAAALCDGGVFGTFIDWRGWPVVHACAIAAALTPLNLIVWNKTNAGMGSLYRSKHELLPLFRKGTAPVVNNVKLGRSGRWRANVWDYAGASSRGSDARRGLKEHPTVKPSAMLEDAMLDMTHRGDVVLDPFLGSGSTLIAADRCGRICCGTELDPLYVDVICRRYQGVTGRPAIHAETGLSFDALGAQRTAGTAAADADARTAETP